MGTAGSFLAAVFPLWGILGAPPYMVPRGMCPEILKARADIDTHFVHGSNSVAANNTENLKRTCLNHRASSGRGSGGQLKFLQAGEVGEGSWGPGWGFQGPSTPKLYSGKQGGPRIAVEGEG